MKLMPSFGRYLAASLLVSALLGAHAAGVRAQSVAGGRYESLLAEEMRVSTTTAATADDFRAVINGYWNFVRRYPTSGYSDNALWQAANLSAEAFQRFTQDRDKFRAVQLFQWLRDQYPHSPLRTKASERIEHLETMAAATTTTPAASDITIRAVHREVLPDVVRVTVELDREVAFYQERLDGPARLFFDLRGTKTVPSLVDATFRYDSDIIRHIRLGRHPNSTTRVVLDLENVARYSVFTLYNPYRIVIDAERGAPAPSAPNAPVASTSAPTSHNASTSAPSTHIASADKTVDRPNTPVIAGKPLPPSANSSGKFSVARQLGLGVSRVVIDAGHGGHDPGASAFGISEAELVLDVTLRLEKLLKQQPGIEVVLTRRTNEYVSLDERTEIANRESADLFLSVHANASANGSARGVETYFLNFALNPQAEAVAARENAASGKTMNSLPSIIKAITLNSKLNESRDFAASIQRSLVRGMRGGNRTLKDLGVKQAPFVVLIGAAMPSVLAEISFVTNQQEARLLKLPRYRQRIAEALLAGILRYQQSLKKVQTAALN
jgi:N-acetylmuramoyl-L-alanine amidase